MYPSASIIAGLSPMFPVADRHGIDHGAHVADFGVAPATNALVRGTAITATVRLSDQSGVFSVLPLSGTTGIRYTARVPIPTIGRATVCWYVSDIWGNAATVYQTVIADNIELKLTVTRAPANKAKVKGTVTVTAAASDTYGVARVELLVNGRIAATDSKAAYQFGVKSAGRAGSGMVCPESVDQD